jgi:hypothetical protein
MKTSQFRFVVLLVAICFFGGQLHAWASHSPNLDSAIESLKTAETLDDPTPKLKEAIKWLNRASNDKGGKRDQAIGLVQDAIALVKSGDMDGAKEKIEHAESEIYAAANHSGNWE